MPGVSDEAVNHFGQLFPFREEHSAALPAQISARLFLRHLGTHNNSTNTSSSTDWLETFEVLGVLHSVSCKQQQFRSAAAAAAVRPPVNLMVEVRGGA